MQYFCVNLPLDSDYFKFPITLFVLFTMHSLDEVDFILTRVDPEDIVNHSIYSRMEVSTALINKINEQAYRGLLN